MVAAASTTKELHLLGSLCLIAFSLSGCGGGGGTPTVGKPRITVLVARHCLRSTLEDGIVDIPGMSSYNNYSKTDWPLFGVPAFHCLERGKEVMVAIGKWLKDHADLPSPFQVVADDVARDKTTAEALLAGLSANPSAYQVSSAPFNPAVGCLDFTADETADAISAQRESIPMPDDFTSMIAYLNEVLQPPLKTSKWDQRECVFNKSLLFLEGTCSAASEFMERFLMEWGGGLETGWGRLAASRIPHLLEMHSWFRQVQDAVPKLASRGSASIARSVSAALEDPSGATPNGTKIFVGHDTQLNGLNAILGLIWKPNNGFPVNVTLPGSMLRFDTDGSTVTISYLYPTNYSDAGDAVGSMTSVPAVISGLNTNTISLEALQRRFAIASNSSCGNMFVFNESATSPPALDPDNLVV